MQGLGFVLDQLQVFYITPHQALHNVEVVVLVDGPLAIAADTQLAVVAEVLELASMKATVDGNIFLRKVVAIHHLLGVQVHVSKLVIKVALHQQTEVERGEV